MIEIPTLKPWAVMCCDCTRMMTRGGKPWEPDPVSGLVMVFGLASFDTQQGADAAAKKAGWQVADDKGSNHRCPECLAKPKASHKRGAFVKVA